MSVESKCLSLNLPAASFKGLPASSCQNALFLWELEEMDPAAGRCAVHFVAFSRPAIEYLGTAEVRGQFKKSVDVIDVLLYVDA